jgi:hypothetical protein
MNKASKIHCNMPPGEIRNEDSAQQSLEDNPISNWLPHNPFSGKGTYGKPEKLDLRYKAQGSEPTSQKMNMSYGRTPRRIEVTIGMMNDEVFVAIPVLYGGKSHYSSSNKPNLRVLWTKIKVSNTKNRSLTYCLAVKSQ